MLALTPTQSLIYIQIPQAVERVYPALVSQFVLMMLATSIMSQISAEELTGAAYMIQSFTFRGFEVYLVIAVIYLALASLLRTRSARRCRGLVPPSSPPAGASALRAWPCSD